MSESKPCIVNRHLFVYGKISISYVEKYSAVNISFEVSFQWFTDIIYLNIKIIYVITLKKIFRDKFVTHLTQSGWKPAPENKSFTGLIC